MQVFDKSADCETEEGSAGGSARLRSESPGECSNQKVGNRESDTDRGPDSYCVARHSSTSTDSFGISLSSTSLKPFCGPGCSTTRMPAARLGSQVYVVGFQPFSAPAFSVSGCAYRGSAGKRVIPLPLTAPAEPRT